MHEFKSRLLPEKKGKKKSVPDYGWRLRKPTREVVAHIIGVSRKITSLSRE